MTRKQVPSSLAPILKRQYWRSQDAEAVLSAARESGMSLSAFARRHGVQPRRLMRWRGWLAKNTLIRFHPVQVVSASRSEPVSAPSRVELVLRSGHRVAVHRGFDPALLEDLVRAVGSWSC
jgi:transposase